MKLFIRRFAASGMAIALLLLVSCGGKQTVASRSAEAFREAPQKGTPAGGDSHRGHIASATPGTTTGMDHSTMTGMDHSTMAKGGQPGMGHSKMQSGQSMAGMDHSKMQSGKSMAAMDHSKMQSGQSMAGMDHSKVRSGQSMAGMDHSKMQRDQSMAGMDHSKMQSGQSMSAMDHGSMPGMQHGAGVTESAAMSPPTTSDEMQQLRPAATLQVDNFDAPVPISVSEAMKTPEGGGHEGHGTDQATPERANLPTPKATPVPERTGNTPAPAMDHSAHGQRTPSRQPRPQPRASKPPQARPAAATIYACPMHPEVTSEKPGTCPKCGMALVKRKK